jgi:MFS family permease
MVLSSFGQAILLPLSAYLAERWFPLEQRSIAISLSFYSNLLGFASGAIYTTLFVTSVDRVMRQMFVVAVVSTFCFVVAVVLVKNKPKVLMEKYRLANWKQLKELWKYKFNTYSIFMSSVFLGASWSFLSNSNSLPMQFQNSASSPPRLNSPSTLRCGR